MQGLAKFRRILNTLFSDGWLFFIPYLVVYLAGVGLNVGVRPLSWVFLVMHFSGLALFGFWVQGKVREAKNSDRLFRKGTFLVLWACGTFLEFPSDAWEHWRRIFSWQTFEQVRDNPIYPRFYYFLAWSTSFLSSIPGRRYAVDLLNGSFLFLLVYQSYLFALRLGFDKSWSKVQAMGFLILFGTNLFNIRTYGISSTPIAYVAYFQSLIVLLDVLDGNYKSIRKLALLLPLILLNHVQEIIFLALMACSFAAFAIGRKHPRLAGLGIFLSLAFGIVFMRLYPRHFAGFGDRYFTFFSTIKFWKHDTYVLETLGLHGVLAMIAAILLWNRQRRLSLLTLAPLFMFVFPPLVVLFVWRNSSISDSYRFLYMFPSSFALVAGIKYRAEKITPIENVRLYAAVMALLIFAAPAKEPWRGRLYFQFVQSSPERSLVALDSTAVWFQENRRYPKDCRILADEVTQFYLTSQLGWPLAHHPSKTSNDYRLQSIQLPRMIDIQNADMLDYWIRTYQPTCGILVANKDQVPHAARSKVADRSHHWLSAAGDMHSYLSKNFEGVMESWWKKTTWTKTAVPPFYTLYEPPRATAP